MDTLIMTSEQAPSTHFCRGELELLAEEGILTSALDRYWFPTAGECLSLRLACARLCLPEALRNRAIVGWASAAWIHGWMGKPPKRLDVLLEQSRRTSSHMRGRAPLVIHEVKDPWDRTLNYDGLFVTDHIRTVYDVARYSSDEIATEVLPRALADPNLRSKIAVDQWLNRQRLPLRERSRMRLRLRAAGLDLRAMLSPAASRGQS